MKRIMGKKAGIDDRQVGLLAAVLSALLFGISPSLAKLAYQGGSNPLTMTFTRALLGLPVLILMAKKTGVSLRLTKAEALALLPVSLLGSFATTILLYSSYAYIGVGTATVLHYLFPVLVMIGGLVFFREKINGWKLIALLLGFSGVLSFLGTSDGLAPAGVLLALASAFSYAGLMVGIERTVIRRMPVLKVAVYSNILACLASLILALPSRSLRLDMGAAAWFYSLLVSLMVAVGAFSLLNLAILKTGATTTAIVAMLEPLTSVLVGWLLLKEKLTPLNLAGFALILAGVFLVSYEAWRRGGPKKARENQ